MSQSELYARRMLLFMGVSIGNLIGGAIYRWELSWLHLPVTIGLMLTWLYFGMREVDESIKEKRDASTN